MAAATARAASLLLEEREVGARVELLDFDMPGFWEQNGYHMRGDPWTEERYGGMSVSQAMINKMRKESKSEGR